MEHFTNKSESFYREIRSIEIYNASDISYIDNFQGIFPDSNLCLYKFEKNIERTTGISATIFQTEQTHEDVLEEIEKMY